MPGNFRPFGTLGMRVTGVAAAALLLTGITWVAVLPQRTVAAAAGVKPVQVQMKNFAFDPPAITIKAGRRLTWTNDDVVPHTATADKRAWDSGQMAPGHSFTVAVTKPGTYQYSCSIHPFMHAKIIVTN